MDARLRPYPVANELLVNMEALTKAQVIEVRAWIRDCSWLDQAEDLEDLTDKGGNAEFGQNSTLRLKAVSCIACEELT